MRVYKVEVQGFEWNNILFGKVYTSGCSWRCGYCFVPEIVKSKTGMSGKDAISKIKMNRIVGGICVTGGEPTEQKDLPIFLKELKLLGLKVMIETNGDHPDMLEKLIKRKLVDFVRIDVKAPWEKYPEVTGHGPHNVKRSIELMKDWSGYWEIITVWHPMISKDDLIKMANQIDGRWVIIPFEPGNCLDSSLNKTWEWDEDFLAGLKKDVWVRTKGYERRLS